MIKTTSSLGPYLRRFLVEDLLLDRNFSQQTQASYRDTFVLLLRFMKDRHRIPPERVAVEDLTAVVIREFLAHLQKVRGNSDSTRNQRLAAIHSFFRFVGREAPEYVELSTQVNAVPFRKVTIRPMPYLEKQEMEAVLAVPDRKTALA